MYLRLHAHIAALSGMALALGGCTQMMRHSNMVVFGTNTVVGVRIGTAATQVPSIDVGYTRQEAVLMPLVANTATSRSTTTENNGKTVKTAESEKLAPCDMSQPVTVVAGSPAPPSNAIPTKLAPHPCLLAAENSEQGAKDSYSVLASFGAHFDTSSKTSEASAKGGLAQYFATGMAAQLLALNGGASVVAVSDAAKESAKGDKLTLDGATAAGSASDNPHSVKIIEKENSYMKIIRDDWKCGDPSSDHETFEKIISDGNTKYKSDSWDLIKFANSKKMAEDLLSGTEAGVMNQFLESMKSTCGG